MAKQYYQDGEVYVPGSHNEKEMIVESVDKKLTFEDIEKANKLINTIELKGKQYAEVKERVIAFRRLYPNGSIIPDITHTDNYIICEATILDEKGKVLAKGHARELSNRSFALENVETSAIGRAIGFVGLGISTSIASAEEMQNVEDKEIFDEEIIPIEKLVEEFEKLYSAKDKINILNGLHVTEVKDLGIELLKKYIDYAKEKK